MRWGVEGHRGRVSADQGSTQTLETLESDYILTDRNGSCALVTGGVFKADAEAGGDWATGREIIGRDGPDWIVGEVWPIDHNLVAVRRRRATTCRRDVRSVQIRSGRGVQGYGTESVRRRRRIAHPSYEQRSPGRHGDHEGP